MPNAQGESLTLTHLNLALANEARQLPFLGLIWRRRRRRRRRRWRSRSHFAGSGSLVNSGTISGGTPGVDSGRARGVQFSGNANSPVNQGGGVINGGVEMTSSNHSVTRFTGSVVSGALTMGADTPSLLTLDGAGALLCSSAVTGTTTFAGPLTKQGTGVWTIRSHAACLLRGGQRRRAPPERGSRVP